LGKWPCHSLVGTGGTAHKTGDIGTATSRFRAYLPDKRAPENGKAASSQKKTFGLSHQVLTTGTLKWGKRSLGGQPAATIELARATRLIEKVVARKKVNGRRTSGIMERASADDRMEKCAITPSAETHEKGKS